jgi:hypothetical protein
VSHLEIQHIYNLFYTKSKHATRLTRTNSCSSQLLVSSELHCHDSPHLVLHNSAPWHLSPQTSRWRHKVPHERRYTTRKHYTKQQPGKQQFNKYNIQICYITSTLILLKVWTDYGLDGWDSVPPSKSETTTLYRPKLLTFLLPLPSKMFSFR